MALGLNVSSGAALTGVGTPPPQLLLFALPKGSHLFMTHRGSHPKPGTHQSWVTASAAGMFSTLAANLIPLLALLSVTESVLFSPIENYFIHSGGPQP